MNIQKTYNLSQKTIPWLNLRTLLPIIRFFLKTALAKKTLL